MRLNMKLGRHILVLGPNDSGKTNAMLYLWTQVPKDVTAIWVDLEEDYDKISRLSDITVSEIPKLLDALSKGFTRIHFLEASGNRDSQIAVWDKMCYIANELGQVMLFCDEIMAVCGLFDVTVEHYKSMSRGRKRGVSLVMASQRTQAINKTLITESHTRIAFRMSDYDTTALRQWFPQLHWLRRADPFSFLLITTQDGGIVEQVCKPLPLIIPAKKDIRRFSINLKPNLKAMTPIEELKRQRRREIHETTATMESTKPRTRRVS